VGRGDKPRDYSAVASYGSRREKTQCRGFWPSTDSSG